jgi:hypothetical protein
MSRPRGADHRTPVDRISREKRRLAEQALARLEPMDSILAKYRLTEYELDLIWAAMGDGPARGLIRPELLAS